MHKLRVQVPSETPAYAWMGHANADESQAADQGFSFGSAAVLHPAGWLGREASLRECLPVSQLEALPGLSHWPRWHVGPCLHLQWTGLRLSGIGAGDGSVFETEISEGFLQFY